MVSAAAAETAAAVHYLQFRIQWASIALLYYDYALTFPSEVKYMWGRKFKLSTFLYICCRYALIANVVYLCAVSGRIPKVDRVLRPFFFGSCNSWYKFDGVISVLGRASVIVTLTGRTYAVYGCSRLVLAALGSLGLACVILDIMHVPGLACVGGISNVLSFHSPSCPVEGGLLAILMCVFEFLAAALTITRSIQECRVGKTWKFERGGFFTLVSEQGLSYYCIVSVFSFAAAILNYRAPKNSFFQRIPNAMNLPVACLLTARFLLQLREWQSRESVSAETTLGANAGPVQTLSALRTVAGIDAVLLDDFGNSYYPSVQSWQMESTGVRDEIENNDGEGDTSLHDLRDVKGKGSDST